MIARYYLVCQTVQRAAIATAAPSGLATTPEPEDESGWVVIVVLLLICCAVGGALAVKSKAASGSSTTTPGQGTVHCSIAAEGLASRGALSCHDIDYLVRAHAKPLMTGRCVC